MGQHEIPVGEQPTQLIKLEAQSPTQTQTTQTDERTPIWTSLTTTPKREHENSQGEEGEMFSSCFRLDEVEACVEDTSALSFVPLSSSYIMENDGQMMEDEQELNESDEKNNDPSSLVTSARLDTPERNRGNNTTGANMTNYEEPPVADNNDEPPDTCLEPRPFACSLCTARFPRKLLLSAHIEKRHGVKYVFTERGKKVKLVRMPEGVKKGDKLDPFVELLLKKNAGVDQKSKDPNEIMVQPVDSTSAFAGVAEELDPTDVFKNILGGEANCGILAHNLDTSAYIECCKKGEVPFVAFGSIFTENKFLLRVIHMNEHKQILLPATPADIKNTKGIYAVVNRTENTPCTSAQAEQNTVRVEEIGQTEDYGTKSDEMETTEAMPTSTETDPAPDLSKLNIVAHADVMLNKETKQFEVVITSPVKRDQTRQAASSQFIKLDDFQDMVLLCQPKRLRCLSELYPNEGETSAPETTEDQSSLLKPKRKYTRRNYVKENQAKALAEKLNAEAAQESLIGMPENQPTSASDPQEEPGKRKKVNIGDDDDDEEKDATYYPELETKETRAPKRRTYVRRNNPAKRRLDFEDSVDQEEDGEDEVKIKESPSTSTSPRDPNSTGVPGGNPDPSSGVMSKEKVGVAVGVMKEEVTTPKKSLDVEEQEVVAPPKRKRGRPPKMAKIIVGI